MYVLGLFKNFFYIFTFIIFRYSWTENLYGSSSFPGSGGTTATTQNKTEKSDGEFPEAFEAEEDGDKTNEESITLYPTSPQRSGSLLEVTDHLGKFSILILICYIYTFFLFYTHFFKIAKT